MSHNVKLSGKLSYKRNGVSIVIEADQLPVEPDGERYIRVVQRIPAARATELDLSSIDKPGAFFLRNLSGNSTITIAAHPCGKNALIELGPGLIALGTFADDCRPTAVGGDADALLEYLILEA